MSGLPPPSRPDAPVVEPPRTGAALPPPRPAVVEPVIERVVERVVERVIEPVVAVSTEPTLGRPITEPPRLAAPAPSAFEPPRPEPEPARPAPADDPWSAFAPPAVGPSADTGPVHGTGPAWQPLTAPPDTAWTHAASPEPAVAAAWTPWSPGDATAPVAEPALVAEPTPLPVEPAGAALAPPAPAVLASSSLSFAPPAAVDAHPVVPAQQPAPESVSESVSESFSSPSPAALAEAVPPNESPSIWDQVDIPSVPWDPTPAAPVDPWRDSDIVDERPHSADSSASFSDTSFTDTPFIDTSFTDTVDDTFDDDGADAARAEIEALIAQAEAEAAQRGDTAPLVFAEPDGVDLTAIVASQPQEPPRAVLDATTPGGDSPTWLTDLVDSIEDGDDEPAAGAEPTSSVFVSADTVIRARPARVSTNPFAVLSLMASIAWVCGLGSIVGIVFGIVALVQIASVHQRGRVLALGGLLLGVVGMTAALTLFVFDSNEATRTVITDPPAFGEVVVTSCALDSSGHGAAVVRVVNVTGDRLTYSLTVAFQAGDDRAVESVESGVLEPGATELITAVSSATFTEAPVCRLQDMLRFVEGE